ncbi:MAG: trypsin-like peptidase domain-containing protein [Candidatus Omnitrophota bacterium]|jgi:hypothetical protein
MRNIKNIICAILLFPIVAAQGGTIIDREVTAQCVVQLVSPRVAKVQVDGKTAEVWFRFPDDGSTKPKMEYDIGSGFLVNDSNSLFLVTASHVAKLMTTDSFVNLMGQKGETVRLQLAQLSGKNSPTNWLHHDEADVAVLELFPSPEIANKYLQQRFLPAEIIAADREAPSRNLPLTVFGFPLGIGSSEKKFSPLTKQSHCASDLVTLKLADAPIQTTIFFLEDPSIEGYSGGPVLDISIYKLGAMQTTGSGTKLWGLIHGTSSDSSGGKLAVVVPSYFILETIQKAVTK